MNELRLRALREWIEQVECDKDQTIATSAAFESVRAAYWALLERVEQWTSC